MMLYTYKCRLCGNTYDFKPGEVVFCEDGHDRIEDLSRVYNLSGIVFKGSGFYKKDNQ